MNKERILMIYALIDDLLIEQDDNPIYEQYRSRSIANYTQAIKNLMEVDKYERMDNPHPGKK